MRFEEKKGKNTKVTFVTDGMAIRELMISVHYDVFILDEAHERSINTDVLMAILKSKLQTGKKFRIVVMSATIETNKFLRFWDTEAMIKVEGRTYPTKIYNLL